MKKNGFTLVELIAVLVILSIIAVLAAPNIVSLIKNSKDKTLISDVGDLVTNATYMYKSENKRAKSFEANADGRTFTIYMRNLEGSIPTEDSYGYTYVLDNVSNPNDVSYIKFQEPLPSETNGSRKVIVHIKSCNKNNKCHYVCSENGENLTVDNITEDTCPIS